MQKEVNALRAPLLALGVSHGRPPPLVSIGRIGRPQPLVWVGLRVGFGAFGLSEFKFYDDLFYPLLRYP